MYFPGKIPIRIYPFFWILILLIGWISSFTVIGTVIWACIILISVLVHEFGHALTAVFFKQRAQIELFGMGGLTLRHGPPLKFWQEFIIVLNGPLAGFLLCILAYKIHGLLGGHVNPLVSYAFNVTIYVNLFWTIVNLLPILPLDGGQLLRIVLEGFMGIRGVKIALFLSMLLASVVTVVAFVYQEIFIGSLFFLFTFESYRNWQNSLSLTEQDQSKELQKIFKDAEREMQQGDLNIAYQKFQHVRELSKAGILYMAATEYMAIILNRLGKHREAYTVLSPFSKKLSIDSLRLLHQLAYKIGNWNEAIELGNKAYQQSPSYDTAVINAFCHAILGKEQPAIGWLKTAINDGLPNPNHILWQREFDHIRDNPQFQKLMK